MAPKPPAHLDIPALSGDHTAGQGAPLAAHVYGDLMPRTFAPTVQRELPATLDFHPTIYRASAADLGPEIPAASVKQILKDAPGIKFSSAAENAKNKEQPDYIMDSSGKLHKNPDKTTPPDKNKPLNIQVQSDNQKEYDYKKSANDAQKAQAKEMINFFKSTHPAGTDVPQKWLDQLNADNLPPAPVPLAAPETPAPTDQTPSAPQPTDQTPAPVSQPSGGDSGSGGGSSGGGSSGGGSSGGDGGGSSGGGSSDRGTSTAGSDNPGSINVDQTPQPGELKFEGPPTITPQKIDEILQQMHSPAANEHPDGKSMGQFVYDEGVKNGINPAVALAFFIKESSAGTAGVARETHSWGNIRGDGPSGFKQYDNYADGLKDWYSLIKNEYLPGGNSGHSFNTPTVDQALTHYAPSSDGNDPNGYAQSVKRMVNTWAESPEQKANLKKETVA